MASYAGLPPGPLSAYLNVREANRAGNLQDLQQAGAVQGILSRMREEQEINQLKGVVQQAGGNPEKAIQALIAAGTPKSLALAAQLKGLVPKPAEPFTLAPGAQRRGPGGELLASAPFKPETPSPVSRLIAERDALPVGDPRRKALDDAITKASTHAPGVQVNYPPSAGFGIDPATGKRGHYTIGKDGTLRWDAVEPIPGPAEVRASQAKIEDAATLSGIETRTKRMADILQKNYGVVGPAGFVRRLGEAGLGAVPGAGALPTPAIDYKNETGLLLADVRKMVEKDPNLSNQERQNLLETMGAGMIQTPGSALRALKAVSDYVTRKKGGTGFEVGKIYQDANGNRARYTAQGTWEPVQ